MTQTKSKPAAEIRMGVVKAVIWANPGKDDKPTRYSVQYLKGYKTQDGTWKDTNSFSEIDNLKIGVLYSQVAIRITELKKQNTAEQTVESD